MSASRLQTLSFDEFSLDPARGLLQRGDKVLPLRRQSLDVLRHLAEHAGTVVTNDELIAAVWTTAPADYAASVVQCIMEVRRALGREGRWIIKTVSGRGYQFVAEVVCSATSPAV